MQYNHAGVKIRRLWTIHRRLANMPQSGWYKHGALLIELFDGEFYTFEYHPPQEGHAITIDAGPVDEEVGFYCVPKNNITLGFWNEITQTFVQPHGYLNQSWHWYRGRHHDDQDIYPYDFSQKPDYLEFDFEYLRRRHSRFRHFDIGALYDLMIEIMARGRGHYNFPDHNCHIAIEMVRKSIGAWQHGVSHPYEQFHPDVAPLPTVWVDMNHRLFANGYLCPQGYGICWTEQQLFTNNIHNNIIYLNPIPILPNKATWRKETRISPKRFTIDMRLEYIIPVANNTQLQIEIEGTRLDIAVGEGVVLEFLLERELRLQGINKQTRDTIMQITPEQFLTMNCLHGKAIIQRGTLIDNRVNDATYISRKGYGRVTFNRPLTLSERHRLEETDLVSISQGEPNYQHTRDVKKIENGGMFKVGHGRINVNISNNYKASLLMKSLTDKEPLEIATFVVSRRISSRHLRDATHPRLLNVFRDTSSETLRSQARIGGVDVVQAPINSSTIPLPNFTSNTFHNVLMGVNLLTHLRELTPTTGCCVS